MGCLLAEKSSNSEGGSTARSVLEKIPSGNEDINPDIKDETRSQGVQEA